MSEASDNHDARAQSERSRAAHKAAIQSVAERNEAAHREAKKKRVVLDERKAEVRRNANR